MVGHGIYLLLGKFDRSVCTDPLRCCLPFFLRRNGFQPFQRDALRRGFEDKACDLIPLLLVGNVLDGV